jgi:hypothetical protein
LPEFSDHRNVFVDGRRGVVIGVQAACPRGDRGAVDRIDSRIVGEVAE